MKGSLVSLRVHCFARCREFKQYEVKPFPIVSLYFAETVSTVLHVDKKSKNNDGYSFACFRTHMTGSGGSLVVKNLSTLINLVSSGSRQLVSVQKL